MTKEYAKNKYYRDTEIKQAKQLANKFYNKDYSPQLLRSGNKKLGSNVAIWDLPSIITCKYQCKDSYILFHNYDLLLPDGSRRNASVFIYYNASGTKMVHFFEKISQYNMLRKQ